MERRHFIRLVGGGTLAAAATTAGLSGCSTALPTEAVAAWNGPGDEPDHRRWALAKPRSHAHAGRASP